MTLKDLINSKIKYQLYYYDLSTIKNFNKYKNYLLDYELIELPESTETLKVYKLPINKLNQEHAIEIRKIKNCTRCCRFPECEMLPINERR